MFENKLLLRYKNSDKTKYYMNNKSNIPILKGSKTLKKKKVNVDPKQQKRQDLIYYYIPMAVVMLIFIIDVVVLVLIGLGTIKIDSCKWFFF